MQSNSYNITEILLIITLLSSINIILIILYKYKLVMKELCSSRDNTKYLQDKLVEVNRVKNKLIRKNSHYKWLLDLSVDSYISKKKTRNIHRKQEAINLLIKNKNKSSLN